MVKRREQPTRTTPRTDDTLIRALSFVGVSMNVIQQWLDSCSGCVRKGKRTRQLTRWALKVAQGGISQEDALEDLENIIKGNPA